MHSRKGHQDSVGRCRLFLGLLIFFASIFSIGSSTLAAPAKTALDGTTSGPPKADAWLRSPEGMEVPTGCIIAGISYAFGETCWPTQKVSDCRSTQYTCTNDTQCSPQDVLKLSGLCSDPVGGVRSTCCDPPPACDSSGTCVQPAATVCPGQNLKTCTESVCDCTKRGQCEIRELNPLLCMANIGGCACVYPAPPNDSAVGQDQCKQACQEIGTTQFFYDSRGYCVCTGSGRAVCPNTAIGKPLMTDLTYPKTCSSLSLSWASPAPLVYGQVLPLSYLNAQIAPTGVSGTMTYTYKDPASGTDVLLRAGQAFDAGTYQLKAVFIPEDKELAALTATVSLVVQKKPLNVIIPNVRKAYGAVNPSLTFSVNGFVYDDTFLSVFGNKTPETTAGTASGVGNYPITLTLPTVKNYTVPSQPSATLFVDPVQVGCRAENKRMLVKSAVPQFTYVCTPFVGSDTTSIFGSTGILSAPSLDTTKAADYTITFAQPPSHPNYTVVTANGTLSVYADCVVTNWSVPANPACGTTYLATRTVTTQAANGGAACPYLTETRTASPCCGTALGSKSIACWLKTGTGSGCSCQPTAATLASPYSTLLTTISNANSGFLGCFYSGDAGDSLVGVSGNYEGRLTYFGYQDAGSIVGGNSLTQASYAYLLDVYDVSACKQDCVMSAWADVPNQPACGATKTQSRTIIKPAAYGGVACGPTQQTISNTKCSVTLTWNTPAAIAYGTALSAAQLNATATSNGANVQGTFTYTYPLGKVLDAGTFANTVKFTPNDLNTYAPPGSVSVQQVVTKKALVCSALDQRMAAGTSAPNLTWECANGFVLNQTAAVFTTQPTLTLNGANTKVGGNYPITFSQAPQAANYTISTGDGTMQVYADCVLGDYQPQYSCYFNGGGFSQTQQIITPSVNGGTCSPQTRQIVCPQCPCAGCVGGWRLVGGRSTLASLFGLGANDKVGIAVRDYNFREICKNLLGANAVEGVTYRDYQVMKFDSPGDNKFCGFLPVMGGVLSSPLQKGCVAADSSTGYLSQLYCGCDMNGPNVCGNNRIDPSNYEECDGNVFPAGVSTSAGCTADCKIFAKKVPVISWAQPASIVYGTALSGAQLNARALNNGIEVAGTFTYAPAPGAILVPGSQKLTVTFVPTDTAQYSTPAAASVVLDVTKKEVVCTVGSASRAYGLSTNPAVSFSCAGFVGTDNSTSGFGTPTSTANATSAVGSAQTYTLTSPSSNNYIFTVAPGTLSITQVPVTCTADNKAKSFGADIPPLTYSCTGFVNSESVKTAGTLKTAAVKTSPAGDYLITFDADPVVSTNYKLATAPGTLKIGGSAVNCTVDAKSRVYGDANPPLTFSCTGFVSPDTQLSVFGSTLPTTTANSTSPVGASYDIKLTAPVSTNYAFSIANAKLTIAPAPLTCTAGTYSRLYGDSNPTFGFTCSGLKGADTQAGVLTSQGSFKAGPVTMATPGDYVVNFDTDPLSNANYKVKTNPGKISITKRDVTCTADSKSMTVGSAQPTLTHTCAGSFAAGQTQSVLGTPDLFVEGGTTQAGSSNIKYATAPVHLGYTVATKSGVMTVTNKTATSCTWRTPAALTYGTGLSAALFTDGNAAFPVVTPKIPGQFTFSHSAGQVLNVGTVTMTATFTPTDSANYAASTCTAAQVINPSVITCTGGSYSRLYGSKNPTVGYTCADSKGSNAGALITTAGVFAAGPAEDAVAKTYSVGFTNPPVAGLNYSINAVPASITVTKVKVACSADPKTMIVSSTVPTLTHTCSGFVLGHTYPVLGTPDLFVEGSTSTVGTATIKYNAVPTHGGYEIATTNSILTIVNKTQSKCTWSQPAAITYGAGLNPDLFDATKSASAKEESSILGSFKYTHYGGQVLNVPNGGSVTMTATFTPLDSVNYAGTTCSTSQVVNPAPISCKGKSYSRTYGDANPVFEYMCTDANGTDVTPLTTSNTKGVFDVGPAKDTVAGTYSVAFTTQPSAGSNYLVTTSPASLVVSKVAATCTADSKTVTVGATTPALTHSCVGLVLGQTTADLGAPDLDVEGSTSTVGTAAIKYQSVPTHGGYLVTTKNGTLTVLDKTATKCTWAQPAAVTFGTGLAATTFDATGGAKENSGIPGSFKYNYKAGDKLNAGSVTMTATFTPTDTAKYAGTTCTTVQVVNKAPITCSGKSYERYIGFANPNFEYTCVDSKNGDASPLISTAGTFTAGPALDAPAGTYNVDFATAPASTSNYAVTTNPATLKVTGKAPTSCNWVVPAAITYGTVLPAATFNSSLGGAKESSSIPGSFTYTHQAGQLLDAGTHTMTATFAPTETAKYAGSQCVTTQTVNKATAQCSVTNVEVLDGTVLGTSLFVSSAGGVGGTFAYSFTRSGAAISVGVVLKAGDIVNVSAVFTPAAPNNYNGSTCSGTITVKAKTAVSCTMSTLDISVNETVTKAALEAKSAFTAADSAALAGSWSYKYTTTNQIVTYGVKVAKGSYGVTATFVPTNSAQYAEASCAGTLRVSDCSAGNQAIDCNDGNDCTTDRCSTATRACVNTYLGEQGSLGPTMTITCPSTLTLRWNDTLRCVNPSESPQYALGVDSSTAPSLSNYPGNLKSMSTTKVARSGCSGGTCTEVFTDISSVYFENGKTLYGGVGSIIMGALQKQSATSASGTCAAMCVEDGSCMDSQMTASSINRNCDCCYKTADGVIDKDTCEQYANYAPDEALTCNCPDIAPCPRGNIVLNSTGRLVCGTKLQELCGNGFINENVGEQCDGTTLPANAPAGSTCSVCKLISPPPINGGGGGAALCGNGIVDTAVGETCDTGNGATAGCRSGCKCVGCKLDCTGGGCKTLVGIQCNNWDASGNVKCTIKTSWGPTAIVTDVSGTETDCSDRNCCPSNGTDTKSVTYPNNVANCMKFTTACPNNKGSLLVPDGFQYSHSPTWMYNPSLGENQIGYKYRCISPGDEGCACGVGTKGCPLADTPEPK